MLGIVILGGLAAIGYGMLKVFAGGMSDAADLGEQYAKSGCIIASCGAAVAVVAIVLAIL
jgi:hypothetical protein